MAQVIVNYDTLGVVQTNYNNLADDELNNAVSKLTNAKESIEEVGKSHDNIWSNVVSSLQSEIGRLNSGIDDVLTLSDMTRVVSETFSEAEGQIINNINELADYFGMDPNASYTVTANTGATPTPLAETRDSDTILSSDYYERTTGAVTGSLPMTTALRSENINTNKKNVSELSRENSENKDTTENKQDNPTQDAPSNEEKTDTKDSSTYKKAQKNAEEVSKTTNSKNVTNIFTPVAGTTAMGAASSAARNIGQPTNPTSTTDEADELSTDEEIKGQAIGEILDDDSLINEEVTPKVESGTHQTSPIDVTIDKNTSIDSVPVIAGVASAGLAGIGTKVILDKKEKDDDKEEDEEETFSGDYETAGETSENLLDSSDDIGFDPETIIEEDEPSNQTGLEDNIYPQSVLQDLQSKEELM